MLSLLDPGLVNASSIPCSMHTLTPGQSERSNMVGNLGSLTNELSGDPLALSSSLSRTFLTSVAPGLMTTH